MQIVEDVKAVLAEIEQAEAAVQGLEAQARAVSDGFDQAKTAYASARKALDDAMLALNQGRDALSVAVARLKSTTGSAGAAIVEGEPARSSGSLLGLGSGSGDTDA
jgi:ABC-type transporter Mla subunit MlaD